MINPKRYKKTEPKSIPIAIATITIPAEHKEKWTNSKKANRIETGKDKMYLFILERISFS